MIYIIRPETKSSIFARMCKRITAILLFLSFTAQTFSSPFVMLDYYLNTAAYAKNCINKARPKLHCNGKCQAMKKMREEERKEQQANERAGEYKVQQVLSSRSFFCLLVIPARTSEKLLPHGSTTLPINHTVSVFHPPQLG